MSTSNFDPPLTHVSAAFHIFSEFAKYFGNSFVDASRFCVRCYYFENNCRLNFREKKLLFGHQP